MKKYTKRERRLIISKYDTLRNPKALKRFLDTRKLPDIEKILYNIFS